MPLIIKKPVPKIFVYLIRLVIINSQGSNTFLLLTLCLQLSVFLFPALKYTGTGKTAYRGSNTNADYRRYDYY